jgi:predicted solute-binding protein
MLYASKRRGMAHLDDLAAAAAKRLVLPEDVCARYLRLLDYDMSQRDLEGLRVFLEMAVPEFTWDDVRVL